jgi:hypothetical protein
MSCHPFQIAFYRIAILFLGWLISGSLISQYSLLAQPSASGADPHPEVECVTPNGQESTISRAHVADPSAVASIIDDATLSCPLREGDTTFIIALPNGTLGDRFTFINENRAACGELKIAVSDSRLAADSPNWTEVDGIIPFSHKRLFNLSMLGVETKFVRLCFHVESASGDLVDRTFARVTAPFPWSELSSAINSHYMSGHVQRMDIAASFDSLSVTPTASTLGQ